MGKKGKIGKSRRDKFYHLAKESGYRSRAAFKLLQLNRKYEFLQKSRVCIDLCSAPGGWSQVAVQHMPVSSLIIGLDLVPIKPIPGVRCFQEDITTEKCRQKLKTEMQTWKADVVLNDGAPNVGQNWIHDAFQQAQLTLQALKLATEFLRKGGWFVTKLFRSQDYHSLMWVFTQLFKKVHATKPQASRSESAEIFVVCQHFLAPDKLDPKFTNPKFVFQAPVESTTGSANILNIDPTKKVKALGYKDTKMHHTLNATEFFSCTNHLEILLDINEILIDDPLILNHPTTTDEIKENCKDIKVLGKREIRMLLNWRKKLKVELEKKESTNADVEAAISESEDEEAKLSKQLEELKETQRLELRRQRKKVMKEKRKLRDKMNLDMIIPGDQIEMSEERELFSIKRIKTKNQLIEVDTNSANAQQETYSATVEPDSDNDIDSFLRNRKKTVAYSKFKDSDSEEEAADLSENLEFESDDDFNFSESAPKNPLLLDLLPEDEKNKRNVDLWFNKPMFDEINDEDDLDLELNELTEDYQRKGGTVLDKQQNTLKTRVKCDISSDEEEMSLDEEGTSLADKPGKDSADLSGTDDATSSESSDSDSDSETYKHIQSQKSEEASPKKGKSRENDFEVVPATGPIKKLDAVGMAIGSELIKSKKRRRELIEQSFNRYTFGDEDDLPEWFRREEAKFNRPQLPVSCDQINEYKLKLKAINARPIKKIAEAKARKKLKMQRRLSKARQKAEAVSDSLDVSDKEKWKQIKDIYNKAGLLKTKKKELSYVVAKRGKGASRPNGVKGHYKVVDPRLKKDKKNRLAREKKNKKQKRRK